MMLRHFLGRTHSKYFYTIQIGRHPKMYEKDKKLTNTQYNFIIRTITSKIVCRDDKIVAKNGVTTTVLLF